MRDGYAIYLRKSRADAEAEQRGEGETLARHERALTAYAREHHLPIIATYREIVSGDSIADRPQMQALLQAVSAKRFIGVLVIEIERLTRGDQMDQALVNMAFRYSDTLIITPEKTYDSAESTDEIFMDFRLLMSRQEYKTINARLMRGKRLASEEGCFVSAIAPYGYERYQLPTKQWSLRIVEDEAETVKNVFKWYLSGDGVQRIAHRLNDMGIKTHSGKPWAANVIAAMLERKTYTGRIAYSTRKQTVVGVDQTTGKKIRKRLKQTEYIEAEGLHEAIISQETFDAAQKLRNRFRNAATPTKCELVNPFATILRCAKCGAAMRTRGHSNKRTWICCPTYGCNTVGATLDAIETALFDVLDAWKIDSTNYQTQTQKPSTEAQKAAISKQLAKLQTQREKLCDFLERGIYDEETFVTRNAKLQEEIENLKMKLTSISSETVTDPRAHIAAIMPRIETALDAYRLAETAQQKNDILRSVFDRIDYSKTERGNYHKDANGTMTLTVFPLDSIF